MSTNETQFSQLFREFVDAGVAASADSLSLKVSAAGTNMTVQVQPGFAVVRGFAYNSSAVENLTISAAAAQARTDRIVLRLDPSVNSVVLAVKAGTPGSATPPALTQTDSGIYELPLAQVLVGASVSVIASGNVTDERIFSDQGVTNWSSLTRPSSARQGKLGYNRSSGQFEFWSGSAWAPMVPSVPIGSVIAYGGGVAPDGWHLCDGSAHGSAALQAVIGSANAPDLRGRFIVGAGPGYAVGDTGGAESVTLTAAQSGLPAHSHTASAGNASADHSHPLSSGVVSSAGAHTHPSPATFDYALTANGGDATAAKGSGSFQYVSGYVDNIPSAGAHTHTLSGSTAGQSVTHSHTVTVNSVSAASASASHENRPPFYALTYIIRKV